MGRGREKPAVSLIEPVPVADLFASGIAKVEIYGTFARYYLYTERKTPSGDIVWEVVGKIVVPLEALPANAKATMDAMAEVGLTFGSLPDAETSH